MPQIVQLPSLSELVLQPHASHVHRCPAEPDADADADADADDDPPPAEGDDDSSLFLDDLSIIERELKKRTKYL